MRARNTIQLMESNEEDFRNYFDQIHLPLQKTILFYCAPVVVAVFIYWHRTFPSWQSVVLLCASCVLVVLWIIEYRLAHAGKMVPSVACFILPTVGLATLVMLLLNGFNSAALWPMIASMVYAGIFSRRLLIVCGVAATSVAIFSEMVKYFEIYSMFMVNPEYKLIPVAAMSLACGPVIIFNMRRSQIISEAMFSSLGTSNTAQQNVIATINGIQPEIDDAVEAIKQISSKVANQSTSQAAAATQINATMERMKENAIETAANAAHTHAIAQSTRTKSLENSERLKAVEQGFDQVMTMISRAESAVTDLAAQMERIEEFLDFNREIGEQIKVLGINAAIEADSAGEYGKGFTVVTDEFKNMIHNTDENMSKSRSLLHIIRDQARESSRTIGDGSDQLARYFEKLRITGQTVEESAESFYQTAKQVAQITESARRQQNSVAEVSSTMTELDRASTDLSSQAFILLDNVNKIVASQEKLERVLAIE